MTDSDYEMRYMKYKKKYLDLKAQIAGDEPGIYTSIVVTHNARLRCLIDELFPDFMGRLMRDYDKKHGITKPTKEIRFKNGCILEWHIEYDEFVPRGKIDFSIRMVYSGRVKNRKPGLYFVSPNDKSKDRHLNNDINFPEINTKIVSSKLKFNETDFGLIKDHYIYIVRHGEAQHNVKKIGFNLTKDTTLTQNGIDDTKETGKELALLIHPGKGNKIYYFSSDLKRTRQTMGIIHEQLKKTPGLNLPHTIYIVPCAHELRYVPGGDCDNENINKIVPFENMDTCVRRQTQCTGACNEQPDVNNLCCCTTNGLVINWEYYNDFYKKHAKLGKDKNSPCTITDLIHEIIYIICKLERAKSTKNSPFNFWRGPYDILIPNRIDYVTTNSGDTLYKNDATKKIDKQTTGKKRVLTKREKEEEELKETEYKKRYATASCGEYYWKE